MRFAIKSKIRNRKFRIPHSDFRILSSSIPPFAFLFPPSHLLIFSPSEFFPTSAFRLPHSDDHLELGLAGPQSFDLGDQIAHDLGKLDAVAGTDPG